MIEIGAAHGYGAFYIGSAMRRNGRGRLVTLEGMDVRVQLARETVERLGVGDHVEVVAGNFAETLPRSLAAPPDLVFSDGGKQVEQTQKEFEQCVAAMRRGWLFFDDTNFSPEIEALFEEFVAHPRVGAATRFRGRWALLKLTEV